MLLPQIAVKKLYDDFGIVKPADLSLDTILACKNIFVREAEIDGAEARILMREDSAVITISNRIQNQQKRKFILSHELGHFVMHRFNQLMLTDTDETFDSWYKNNFVDQEVEANLFAAEYLMPSKLFEKVCKSVCKDHPEILRDGLDLPVLMDAIARYFDVSMTAAFLRFVDCGIHPVIAVGCKDGIVSWFKWSSDFPHYIHAFNRHLPPRPESVASEVFKNGISYSGLERKQWIPKSAWFSTGSRDRDSTFYEYCIYSERYGYSISLIWEP